VIPSELTTGILTALGIGGAWFATWLGRRGKKEDNQLAERGQAFDEIVKLATERLTEIHRLAAERDAANTERERLRVSWEDRWDRQMQRCRDITAPLVSTIGLLRHGCTPEGLHSADDALRALQEHDDRDHVSDG
jgi:hypothetical protein